MHKRTVVDVSVAVVPVVVGMLALATSVDLASGSPRVTSLRCKTVVTKVQGKKSKHRVCATRKSQARPLPPAGTVVAKTPLGADPADVAAGEGSIWVTKQPGGVVKIDPMTSAIVDTFATATPSQTEAPAVAAGDGGVWLTNWNNNTVTRLDPATGQTVATIPVGEAPGGIAVAPGAVWVANHHSDSLSRIDPTTNSVVATVTLGSAPRNGPQGIAATSDAVWSAVPNLNGLVRIDPFTNGLTATIPTGQECGSVAADSDAVWVAAGCGPSLVTRIDPDTNKIVATVTVGASARSVAVGLGSVWVATTRGLDRIDPRTNKLIGELHVPGQAADDLDIGVFGDLAISNRSVWLAWSGELLRIQPS